MTRLPDLDIIRNELRERFPSGRVSPAGLGDSLAHVLWESFSDFLSDPEHGRARALLGLSSGDGASDEHALEELLILHMWAQSRAVQLAFVDRLTEEAIREILDQLHAAVFDDMVANGTPRAQVPVFEQRVSARYSEYYAAADRSDAEVGRVALEHLADGAVASPAAASTVLRERAIEVAGPLRDYLEGVDVTARVTNG